MKHSILQLQTSCSCHQSYLHLLQPVNPTDRLLLAKPTANIQRQRLPLLWSFSISCGSNLWSQQPFAQLGHATQQRPKRVKTSWPREEDVEVFALPHSSTTSVGNGLDLPWNNRIPTVLLLWDHGSFFGERCPPILFIYLSIHLFIHSFIHSLIYLFIHRYTHVIFPFWYRCGMKYHLSAVVLKDRYLYFLALHKLYCHTRIDAKSHVCTIEEATQSAWKESPPLSVLPEPFLISMHIILSMALLTTAIACSFQSGHWRSKSCHLRPTFSNARSPLSNGPWWDLQPPGPARPGTARGSWLAWNGPLGRSDGFVSWILSAKPQLSLSLLWAIELVVASG